MHSFNRKGHERDIPLPIACSALYVPAIVTSYFPLSIFIVSRCSRSTGLFELSKLIRKVCILPGT